MAFWIGNTLCRSSGHQTVYLTSVLAAGVLEVYLPLSSSQSFLLFFFPFPNILHVSIIIC